jgi:hypothetical protein
MLTNRDDAELLRADGYEADGDATRSPDPDAGGSASIAVRTVDDGGGTYPVTASRFHKCSVLSILGTESVGSAGVPTVQVGSIVYVANLGLGVPAPDTDHLATFVPHRWVMEG